MKFKMATVWAACALSSALAGCTGLSEGASEAVLISTNPIGADCTVERQGELLAQVSGTPSFVTIKASRNHITILCNKTGYREASYVILGGSVGQSIFFGPEPDNEYDAVANLTLVPIGTLIPATASAPANTQRPVAVALRHCM